MKTSDFYFKLPEKLIAWFPPEERGTSRLLVLKKDVGSCGPEGGPVGIIHSSVKNLHDFIDENTVIIFNNTKVRKARLFGFSERGTRTEFLLLEKLSGNRWKAICNKMKKQKPGTIYFIPEKYASCCACGSSDSSETCAVAPPKNIFCIVIEKDENSITLEFNTNIDDEHLERIGRIPLPPYIKRLDIESDCERYQTIYCDKTGSAAAPTAGLHFTEEIIENLKKKGITTAFVTLHVGMGTFNPIHSDTIENHVMHEEQFEISEETADIINSAKSSGKKILAVGTTSLRTLESAASNDGKVVQCAAGKGKTSLFIYPGYKFKIVDQLFTNFHTPDSTLIVLVSAFAGMAKIKEAYQEAIAQKYRFFSYGDAMLIC